MKIVFVVYHDLKIDARSLETLEALKMLGQVTVVTIAQPLADPLVTFHISDYKNSKKGMRYFDFIRLSKRVIRRKKPDMVCLHDRNELIPFVKRHLPRTYVVCDHSELKIDRKSTSLWMFLLNLRGWRIRQHVKRADVVICPNEERAYLTQQYYKLPKPPVIFDNIHRIDDVYDEKQCEKKYGAMLRDNTFLVVYGGGLWKPRMTYPLIEAVKALGKAYTLVIAGVAPEGMERFDALTKGVDHIHFVGFIPRDEWRYLLRRAHVSVVAFAQDVLNNIHCSSGKMYESFFEGTPILASENPPLKRVCETYGVGISDNDFAEGLRRLKADYEHYRDNVAAYARQLDYDSRVPRLAADIRAACAGHAKDERTLSQ